MIDRQEGYYWVKLDGLFEIAKFEKCLDLQGNYVWNWYIIAAEYPLYDEDFEHINEVRIKFPGEIPD